MSKPRTSIISLDREKVMDFAIALDKEIESGRQRAVSALLIAVAHGLEKRFEAVLTDPEEYAKHEQEVMYRIFEGGNGSVIVSGLRKKDVKIVKKYVRKVKKVTTASHKSFRDDEFTEEMVDDKHTVRNRPVGEIDAWDINEISEWVYEICFRKLEKKQK